MTPPNLYCQTCLTWSVGSPKSACGSPMTDGSRCAEVLISRQADDSQECSKCRGTGEVGTQMCFACNGWKIEYLAPQPAWRGMGLAAPEV